MLEFQSQPPQQPEPIFPELIPLEQDPPEDYDPDTQDNTGHFPEAQANRLNKAQVMFNVFGLMYNQMVLKTIRETEKPLPDGKKHKTIYDPETNERVSVDLDENGNEIPETLHYNKQLSNRNRWLKKLLKPKKKESN